MKKNLFYYLNLKRRHKKYDSKVISKDNHIEICINIFDYLNYNNSYYLYLKIDINCS